MLYKLDSVRDGPKLVTFGPKLVTFGIHQASLMYRQHFFIAASGVLW